MKIERPSLANTITLITIVLIILDLLIETSYYRNFGIQIIHYLDLSEILLNLFSVSAPAIVIMGSHLIFPLLLNNSQNYRNYKFFVSHFIISLIFLYRLSSIDLKVWSVSVIVIGITFIWLPTIMAVKGVFLQE